MKKIFKYCFYLLIVIIFSGLIYSGIQAFSNSEEKQVPGITDSYEHVSDKMLLDDGEFYIALDDIAARNHLNGSSASSIKSLYSIGNDFIIKNKIDVDLETLEIYIHLENDLGKKMFLKASYNYDGTNITSVTYRWYDDKVIFKNILGNVTLGTTRKAFLGSELKVIDTFVYGNVMYKDNLKVLDYKSFESSSSLKKIGRDLFNELFTVGKVQQDVTETTYVINIDSSKVDSYLAGTFNYYHSSHTVREVFDLNYSISLEEEGAHEISEALVFEYSYRNPTTLDVLRFYVLLDANSKYAGIYYYYQDVYHILYYKDLTNNITYSDLNVKFDVTNFETYAGTNDEFALTYLVRKLHIVDNMRSFDSNTGFIKLNEGDLQYDFVLFQ